MCVRLPHWPLQRIRYAQPELERATTVLYGEQLESSLQAARCGTAGRKTSGGKAKTSNASRLPVGRLPFTERTTGNLKVELQRAGHQLVVSRCRSAAEQGVEIGMPLAEAKGLLGGAGDSPGGRGWSNAKPRRLAALGLPFGPAPATFSPSNEPVFLEHDPDADIEGLRGLAVWCRRFSPTVGVYGSDTLLLDITGCAHLFGGERRLAARLTEGLNRWGFVVRTAIAGTIGLAWGVAHYGQKPSSVVIPGREEETLDALPVPALRLSPSIVETLCELAVVQIGQLRALPRASLAPRFGPEVARRLDEALGDTAELIEPVHPPQPVIANREFEHPTTDKRALETVLRELVEQTTAELTQRQQGTQRLEVGLRTHGRRAPLPLVESRLNNRQSTIRNPQSPPHPVTPSPCHPLTVTLLQPTQSAAHLMQLLRTRLERIALLAEVISVQVEAIPAALSPSQQHELFPTGQSPLISHPSSLILLIDRLSNRLGKERVLRPRREADPQPEYAVGWEPVLDAPLRSLTLPARRRCDPRTRSDPRDPGANAHGLPFNRKPPLTSHQSPITNLARPLLLPTEPIPLDVVSVIPDGPPIRFFRQGTTHTVVRWWGPERIEAGWWRDSECRGRGASVRGRGRHARRDYYRVEIEDGRWFWLFRQVGTGAWCLHGGIG